MASFKKVQEMLCLCLIEEIIDEEEFIHAHEAYRPSNLPFSFSAYEKFSLANVTPISKWKKRDIPLFLCVAPFLVA